MKRTTKLIASTALVMLLAGATTVGAAGQARSGERISMFTAPETFPAGAPFHLENGHCLPADGLLTRRIVTDPNTRVEFLIDGADQVEGRDIEFTDLDCVRSYVNVRFGLPAGLHQVEAQWYESGVLVLTIVVDISFE